MTALNPIAVLPRVLVLAGGLSHEREVSLRSGRRLAEALGDIGVDVDVADLDADLIPRLRAGWADLVWPVLHGASGEDGSVREVLALCGVPYVGTGPKACRVAWNKAVAKTVMARAGVDTPEYVTLPQSLFRELGPAAVLDLVVERLGLPLVVKPARGGSALGVSLVSERDQLPRAMVECFSYGDIALVERQVTGVELAISVVADPQGDPTPDDAVAVAATADDAATAPSGEALRALPAVEIVTTGAYDFDARYNPGRTEFFAPARLSADDATRAAELALTAHRELGLRHLSRTDAILGEDGRLWFLEVNVAPGMTQTSLLPRAVAAAGLDAGQVYLGLARRALTEG